VRGVSSKEEPQKKQDEGFTVTLGNNLHFKKFHQKEVGEKTGRKSRKKI
jgi:hypothetical protein